MDIHEFEEALAEIPSVTAVRVASDGRSVTDIHVFAPPVEPAKQVARDVQTVALARFGINLDRRTISVIQIGPTSITADDNRPANLRIGETSQGADATVTLGGSSRDSQYPT